MNIFRSIDQQSSSTIEFDHRRNPNSITYVLQQSALQFHLIVYTSPYANSHIPFIIHSFSF